MKLHLKEGNFHIGVLSYDFQFQWHCHWTKYKRRTLYVSSSTSTLTGRQPGFHFLPGLILQTKLLFTTTRSTFWAFPAPFQPGAQQGSCQQQHLSAFPQKQTVRQEIVSSTKFKCLLSTYFHQNNIREIKILWFRHITEAFHDSEREINYPISSVFRRCQML